MSQKNVLLVEGEADRAFFEALCSAWRLWVVPVNVCTPRDAGHTLDTKQGVFSVLNTTYLNQLADGQIERLAMVIDADRTADGGGFESTLAQLSQRLNPAGYALRANAGPGGLLFAHNDGRIGPTVSGTEDVVAKGVCCRVRRDWGQISASCFCVHHSSFSRRLTRCRRCGGLYTAPHDQRPHPLRRLRPPPCR